MRARPMFTFMLLASALAMPAPAYALALGRLTVDSALGQPLSATIDLAAATRDELESLTAKVADPGLYRQSNLSYQGVLARTRIAVERRPDGRPVLRVTARNDFSRFFGLGTNRIQIRSRTGGAADHPACINNGQQMNPVFDFFRLYRYKIRFTVSGSRFTVGKD